MVSPLNVKPYESAVTLDTLLTALSSIGAMVPAGGAAINEMAKRSDLSTVVDAINATQQQFQYQPRFDQTYGNLQAIAENPLISALAESQQAFGDMLYENTGSPLAGALGQVSLDALDLLDAVPSTAIFAGLRSLDNLGDAAVMTSHGSKTASQLRHDFSRAEELADSGIDPWQETGWFKGADGNWRYEIDDAGFVYDPEGGGLGYQKTARLGDNMTVRNNQGRLFSRTTTVGERFGDRAADMVALNPDAYPSVDAPVTVFSQHGAKFPDLLAAYPATGDYKASVSVIENMPGGGYIEGSFDPKSGFIDMKAPSVDNARSGIGHELMHGVQELEGFAPGANPRMFTQGEEAARARKALSWRRDMRRIGEETGINDPFDLDRMAAEQYQSMGLSEYMPDRETRLLAMDFDSNPSGQLEELVSFYMLDKQAGVPSPSEMYRATAGEVEARNVQNRLDLTPSQRVIMHPLKTQDTPSDRQVIIPRNLDQTQRAGK